MIGLGEVVVTICTVVCAESVFCAVSLALEMKETVTVDCSKFPSTSMAMGTEELDLFVINR